MTEDKIKISPLDAAHRALNARMVPFAGWSMPVQYAGIREEHLAVRSAVGVFDISHMGQVVIEGEGSGAFLDSLLTNKVQALTPGSAQYTFMLNERGGVIDDLIIYRLGEESWFLVINAAKIDEDVAWIRKHLPEGLEFRDESASWAGFAVQGPKASELYARLLPDGPELPKRNGVVVHGEGEGSFTICRTGYTGEDGFEFFCPASQAVAWWDRILGEGATPCGLGARDTLRLEVCYPLNGSDLDPEHTPIEAGLKFFVKLDKGEFMGRDVLAKQAEEGPDVRLAAFRMVGKCPPPRPHYGIFHEGAQVGEICSGTLSPTLGVGIGMAYLPVALAKPGTEIAIDIRGRQFPAETVKKPFYKPGA